MIGLSKADFATPGIAGMTDYDRDLVVWYHPLRSDNGNTKLIDLSGNNIHGTITPGSAGIKRKNAGVGLSLVDFTDTTGTLAIYTSNDLITNGHLVDKVTVIAWVKIDVVAQTSVRTVAGQIRAGAAGADNYGLYLSSSKFAWKVDSASGQGIRVSSANVSANKWYHLVGTYDGANIFLYQNGVLQASVAQTGNLTAATGGFAVGARTEDLSDITLDGIIGEVKVYKRGLTVGEVMDHYEQTKHLYGVGR